MPLIIKSWYGRNGNNIIQLINAIYYGFFLKNTERIIFNKHELLKVTVIDNKENEKPFDRKTYTNNFFYAKKLGFELEPYKMREISQKYIVPILNLSLDETNDKFYIHIRSGDMMRNPSTFLQPPLKYYNTIIDKFPDDNFYLIYEDSLNPCVGYLQKNIKIESQSKSFKEDLSELMKSKRMVFSFSTFSLMVYFLSKNLEEIYLPEYMEKEWYNNKNWGIKKNIVYMDNYHLNLWNTNINNKIKLLTEYNDKTYF